MPYTTPCPFIHLYTVCSHLVHYTHLGLPYMPFHIYCHHTPSFAYTPCACIPHTYIAHTLVLLQFPPHHHMVLPYRYTLPGSCTLHLVVWVPITTTTTPTPVISADALPGLPSRSACPTLPTPHIYRITDAPFAVTARTRHAHHTLRVVLRVCHAYFTPAAGSCICRCACRYDVLCYRYYDCVHAVTTLTAHLVPCRTWLPYLVACAVRLCLCRWLALLPRCHTCLPPLRRAYTRSVHTHPYLHTCRFCGSCCTSHTRTHCYTRFTAARAAYIPTLCRAMPVTCLPGRCLPAHFLVLVPIPQLLPALYIPRLTVPIAQPVFPYPFPHREGTDSRGLPPHTTFLTCRLPHLPTYGLPLYVHARCRFSALCHARMPHRAIALLLHGSTLVLTTRARTTYAVPATRRTH